MMIVINVDKLVIGESSSINMGLVRRDVKKSRNDRFIKIYLLQIVILDEFKSVIIERIDVDEPIT